VYVTNIVPLSSFEFTHCGVEAHKRNHVPLTSAISNVAPCLSAVPTVEKFVPAPERILRTDVTTFPIPIEQGFSGALVGVAIRVGVAVGVLAISVRAS
jgi:hypothetical protein